MSDNSVHLFEQGVASFLTSCIYPAIVAGLKTDGIETSIEKLSQYTNTPIIKSVPSMVASSSSATTTGTRKKTTTNTVPTPGPTSTVGARGEEITTQGTPFVEGKTCAYKFKRGPEIKGKYCGKITQNGSRFCNIKTHKMSEKDSPVNPGIAPTPELAVQDNSGSQSGVLDVEEYDNDLGLYREKVYNFIVTPHDTEEGVVLVVGRLNANNVIVALTEDEEAIARKIGLQFPVLNESVSEPEPVQAIPTAQPIPTIPTAQPIPTIPTAQPIPTIPTAQPIPTIPTAQPIQIIPFAPKVPTIPTVPTIPSGPTK